MRHLTQDDKIIMTGPPKSIVDTVLTVDAYIDTAGFDRATILILAGAGTTDKLVDAYVNEGATTSPATKVTGSDITQLVAASSNIGKIVSIELDLKKRLRYIKPIITVSGGSATVLLACVVILQGSQRKPRSLTESALAERVVV